MRIGIKAKSLKVLKEFGSALGGLFCVGSEAMSRDMKEQEQVSQEAREPSAARIGYPAKLPAAPPTACSRALVILGAKGSGKEAQAIFEGRASRWQITDWRLGRNGMPAWAVDLLRRKLAAAAAEYQTIGAELQPGPGFDWRRNAASLLGRRRTQRIDSR